MLNLNIGYTRVRHVVVLFGTMWTCTKDHSTTQVQL
jgi:hypothetical protein